ncbi:unnamed protein product [Bursaphelenchus xylophilus]|uniref:(pine wood nematode) hypothetical protein n=1 Tax=Bursaphelenchus xylophilus TaxID=6326 RepID=A0A7I8WZC4_BURXY|nr:unnamed protein product [Bursaphelenchus xylophilus]CAG9102469.1 unnamed protein product [Bursaphelenchus xylophilus]
MRIYRRCARNGCGSTRLRNMTGPIKSRGYFCPSRTSDPGSPQQIQDLPGGSRKCAGLTCAACIGFGASDRSRSLRSYAAGDASSPNHNWRSFSAYSDTTGRDQPLRQHH